MFVCCCRGVTERVIRSAIEAGATTVDAVVGCTGAGSRCGSCKPEIAELVAQYGRPAARADQSSATERGPAERPTMPAQTVSAPDVVRLPLVTAA
ncbi:MAG: (2Fe-2S)-binding protein [Polyangiaceae bacterium]